MRVIASVLLLGLVSALAEAGLLPVRQAPAPACSPITMWNFVTVTITQIPKTVTILQQDPNAVASSMASVDTAQVSIESLDNPVSAQPIGATTFTHSIKVSGYPATEVSNSLGASPYYLSAAASSTGKPSASIVAGTITVTVVPTPVGTSHQQDANTSSTGIADDPVHTNFSSPYAGWNGSTSAGSSPVGPATAGTVSSAPGTVSAPSIGSYGPALSTDVQPTQTEGYTSTYTEVDTVYATVPAGGYDSSDYGYGTVGPDGSGFEKRQTCVWISATIDGQEVGWCNNWGGRSTLTYTSWETTTTPSYIPGIGTIPQTSSTANPVTSVEPSIQSPAPSSLPEGSATVQTSPTLSSASSPTPSSNNCGQVGPYQIGFDDLPVYYPTDNNTADFPPIFNPYEHFYWGNGWAFVPPPTEPFPPQSGNHLAQFVPSLNNTVDGSPDAGTIPPSSFGAGPRNYDNNYWFITTSAFVGCDNGSRNLSDICDFVATAYQWDSTTETEEVVATQHFRIPPCPDFQKCQLTQINFNYLFYKMSTISFYANVQGQLSQFWIDSIDMNWYNNTCEAGLARISTK